MVLDSGISCTREDCLYTIDQYVIHRGGQRRLHGRPYSRSIASLTTSSSRVEYRQLLDASRANYSATKNRCVDLQRTLDRIC